MPSLLSTLQAALSAHPPPVDKPGTLRIHTLFSLPHQIKSLYPLAHIHPFDLEACKAAVPVSAFLERIVVTASWQPTDIHSPSPPASQQQEQPNTKEEETQTKDKKQPKQDRKDQPPNRVLIYALEAFLYTIPEYGSAVLYISKLDSTGYGPDYTEPALRSELASHVLPPNTVYGTSITATLSSAFIQHFTTFNHWKADQDPSIHASSSSSTSSNCSSNTNSNPFSVRHVAVHIIARSQHAYLFPGSAENKTKRILSDRGLIKWWRDVMSDVIVSSKAAFSPTHFETIPSTSQPLVADTTSTSSRLDTRAFYLVPGYNKLESHAILPLPPQPQIGTTTESTEPKTTATTSTKQEKLVAARWTYGHPYTPVGADCQPDQVPPLTLHWQQSKVALKSTSTPIVTDPYAPGYDPKRVRSIATLMPHFIDDPKTRFIEELQGDAHQHAGWKMASSSSSSSTLQSTTQSTDIDCHTDKKIRFDQDSHPPPPQDKNHNNETQPLSNATTTLSVSSTSIHTLKAQQRQRQYMDDLSVDEFWERMGFRQESCSGNVIGIFVCLFTNLVSPFSIPPNSSTTYQPTQLPLSLPNPILEDILFKYLMKQGCNWNTLHQSQFLTNQWYLAIHKTVLRKGGWVQSFHPSSSDIETLGKTTFWQDLDLSAPSESQIVSARQLHLSQVRNGLDNQVNKTNVLCVKRKKKPC